MIVLGEIGSGVYNVVLFLHIVAAFVAFAPAFVNPIFAALGRSDAPEIARPLAGIQAKATRTFYLPALVLMGLFGIAMIFLSDEVIKFSQTWISLAFLCWIGVMVIVAVKLGPLEKAVSEGDESAEKQIGMWGGIAHLLFAVAIYAMVFKPGIGA